MKKIIFVLLLAFLFTSCKQTKDELVYVCDCQQQAAASAFVKESIGAANNMSDEEMEDVISQLERTSVKLHCSQKYVSITRGDGIIQTINNAPQGLTIYPNY